MRDEASLRRLVEMGIDVYVPRLSRRAGAMPAPGHAAERHDPRARVVVLARAGGDAQSLLAEIVRALQFARIESIVETSARASCIADAVGLVVFGEALSREAGAAVPVDGRENRPWVAAADLAAVAASGAAKRALWSEIKRLIRVLRAGAPSRAG